MDFDLIDYPFQSHFFNIPQTHHRIHYVDEGPKDGPVLVAVHGNPTWSFLFRHVVQHLSKKGMRVIAIDHLGMGLSDKPQDGVYDLSAHIERLTALIKHLKLTKLSLLVHDWGGAIGMGWAVDYPQMVDKIVITNTAAFNSSDIPKRIFTLKTPILGPIAIRRGNLFAWPATFMATSKGLTKESKKGFLYPYGSYKNRVGINGFVQDIPFASKGRTFEKLESIERGLPALKGQKMILWGMDDFCFHKGFYERWVGLYPEAIKVPLEGVGHYLFEDARDVVNGEIERFFF